MAWWRGDVLMWGCGVVGMDKLRSSTRGLEYDGIKMKVDGVTFLSQTHLISKLVALMKSATPITTTTFETTTFCVLFVWN